MIVLTNKDEYLVELQDLCKLFGVEDIEVKHKEQQEGNVVKDNFVVKIGDKEGQFDFDYVLDMQMSDLRRKSYQKRMIKNFLYQILSKLLNKNLPWGSLTGVRPTKFVRDLIEYGEMKSHLIAETLIKDYYVSPEKAKLVTMILKNQKCIIKNDNLIDLYVNIPICPTRCLYCSFISNELERVKDKMETYLDCLIKEIDAVKKIISKKTYLVRNIYIGGGTPSVLTPSQLDRLLSNLNFPVSEFTVECGRPDTISAEKLDVLKKHGVTRISINPQTFCEATLKRIGRKHKNSQVFDGYTKALERGFVVNMDIIAGLPGEKFGVFKRTINTLLDLYPNNITVHTLSVKNGALLRKDTSVLDSKDIEKMVNYAQTTLIDKGYKPYYMYRQKNQLCGLENVGFYRDEDICVFNIDSMEETNTVIGVGAGAMSKRVFNIEKRIEREPNVKFIDDYINRIDEMIAKKMEFYK